MIDLRLRSKISQEELAQKEGKLLADSDYNLLLTRAASVSKPDGHPLCVYLPGALTESMDDAYPTLTKIRLLTDNRGFASGTKRINAGGNRTRTMPIHSGTLGALDPTPRRPYCRLNAYSRNNLERWEALFPLFQSINQHFAARVPRRYANQQAQTEITHEDWVIPGTVFTTVTINNTYATGVHTDKGDLDQGFSCLGVARKGDFTGGRLVFPEYRIAVEMAHGDLLLMDAHEYHGNTAMVCACGEQLNRRCEECNAERISVVCYYRTKMVACASKSAEDSKFHAKREAAVN